MKKILNYLKLLVLCFIYFTKSVFQSLFHRKKIYILNTPAHGNLGDQAILFAEEKIISRALPKYKIIKIEHVICRKMPKIAKILVGKSPVCLHGGGYLGDLWENEDRTIRNLIGQVKSNKVIFFPQTLCSENPDNYAKNLAKLLDSREDFYIFLRDKSSFDILKQQISKNIFYSPDIVLYLEREKHLKLSNVVVSLRRDKEKTIAEDAVNEIMNSIKDEEIIYKDTVEDGAIVYDHNRKKRLDSLFDIYKNAKLVVTDRLHGMIFAYITNTPCLVFNSKSPKVKGVYQWIKKADYIKLHEERGDIETEIKSILKGNFAYTKVVNKSDFKDIENSLREIVK